MVSNIFGISPQTSQGEFAYKHDVTVPAFKEAKSGAADASINNGTPTIGSSPSVEKLSSQMVLLECTTRHPKANRFASTTTWESATTRIASVSTCVAHRDATRSIHRQNMSEHPRRGKDATPLTLSIWEYYLRINLYL